MRFLRKLQPRVRVAFGRLSGGEEHERQTGFELPPRGVCGLRVEALFVVLAIARAEVGSLVGSNRPWAGRFDRDFEIAGESMRSARAAGRAVARTEVR
jgi:hypothetical protein